MFDSPLRPSARFWLDPLFWTAMAAGPVCWFAIYLWQQPVLQPEWPFAEPLLFLLPVLVYPVIEEIIFRGLIQELIYRYLSCGSTGPLSTANLLTSLLFTGAHFIHHPPLWAALVIFPSLVFGYFKDSTGRLVAPILLHVFYNGGFIWLFAAPS
ncbi:MAG: JDVT-CTERM system glutamic-type intramembrane protease [Gammaproteobacteria bacterium]